MKKKVETAAERYARLKAAKAQTQPLFDVTSPTGMEWKLRKPKLRQFIINGVMPMDLAGKLAVAIQENGGDAQQAVTSLDWEDQLRSLEFDKYIVRYCAVSPRIVENPQGADEVGFDIDPDDHDFILRWATSGGGEADNLESFLAG